MSFAERMKTSAELQADEKRRGASLDDMRAEYLAEVPELVVFKAPTWQEIESKYGGKEEAEKNFNLKVQNLFRRLHNTISYSSQDKDVIELISEMYAIFLSHQQNPFNVPPWMQNFSDYESFVTNVVPDASLRAKAAWSNYLLIFLYRVAVIQRYVEIHETDLTEDGSLAGFYNIEGEWAFVESDDPMDWQYPGAHEYLERNIALEVESMVENGYRYCDLSHMTSSAALEGIAKTGGLISSKRLHERGLAPLTGEYITKASDDFGHKTLNEVYASGGDPVWGYQTLRWFNERPVAFGINRERQRQTIKEQKIAKYGGGFREEESDWGSEGVLMGYEVPLQNIDRIYCLQDSMEEMREWAKEHCAHAELVCWDAVDVIHRYGYRIEQAAIRNQTTPAEEWKKLLAKINYKHIKEVAKPTPKAND